MDKKLIVGVVLVLFLLLMSIILANAYRYKSKTEFKYAQYFNKDSLEIDASGNLRIDFIQVYDSSNKNKDKNKEIETIKACVAKSKEVTKKNFNNVYFKDGSLDNHQDLGQVYRYFYVRSNRVQTEEQWSESEKDNHKIILQKENKLSNSENHELSEWNKDLLNHQKLKLSDCKNDEIKNKVKKKIGEIESERGIKIMFNLDREGINDIYLKNPSLREIKTLLNNDQVFLEFLRDREKFMNDSYYKALGGNTSLFNNLNDQYQTALENLAVNLVIKDEIMRECGKKSILSPSLMFEAVKDLNPFKSQTPASA